MLKFRTFGTIGVRLGRHCRCNLNVPTFRGLSSALIVDKRDHPCFNIELGLVKYRLVNKMGRDAVKASAMIDEYRHFLYLLCTATPNEHTAPSPLINEVWNAHILHTHLYKKHCSLLCDPSIIDCTFLHCDLWDFERITTRSIMQPLVVISLYSVIEI